MPRPFDIDAPLLIAGHPVVAADAEPLRAWVKAQRAGWRNPDRARWRDIVPAQVIDVDAGPDRLLVRTEHGEGWLDVRGDSDVAKVGTWVLVDVHGRSLLDTERNWLDERHDAPLDPNERATVDDVIEQAGHRIIRATWTTPTGLRVATRVADDATDTHGGPIEPDAEVGPLVLVAGRPHLVG